MTFFRVILDAVPSHTVMEVTVPLNWKCDQNAHACTLKRFFFFLVQGVFKFLLL